MDFVYLLWDVYSVEGFDEDEVAIVVRVYYVMVDGIVLYDVATLLVGVML